MLDFYDVHSLLMAFDINMLFFLCKLLQEKNHCKKAIYIYWEILEIFHRNRITKMIIDNICSLSICTKFEYLWCNLGKCRTSYV